MKKNILILALLLVSASCSSSKKPAELARAYDPIIDRNDQVERVVAMIRGNKKLDEKKKNDLIDLVNAQAKKADVIKMKQSQLRAVLIDQLLETPTTAVDIGSCGARAVAARHMDSHRTALMVSIMSEVYNARIQGREATCPPLDFFHAGVDVPSQMMAAVKAW